MSSCVMMPKSCRSWMTGVPLRLNSATTSSYCRSSISPFSLTSASNGSEISSAMLYIYYVRLFSFFGRVALGHRLRQFQFLQFCLDGRGVLRLGDDFLA